MRSGLLWVTLLVMSSTGAVMWRATRPHAAAVPSPQAAQAKPQSSLPISESDLVGSYYFGDGLGMNCGLDLTKDHRFAFRWTGCLGTYDKNTGSWEIVGDTVTLKPEGPNKHEGLEGMDTQFVPVVWKHKLYLLDEYKAPHFLAHIEADAQDEYRRNDIHGMVYVLRAGGQIKEVGLPDYVPTRFKGFMGRKPVEARVTEVYRDGTVTIDKGSSSGLEVGIRMDGSDCSEIELIEVNEHSSTGRPGYFFNSSRVVGRGDTFAAFGEYREPRGTGWARLPKPPSETQP